MEQEILSELRSLRRLAQWSVWLSLAAFAVFAVYFVFAPKLLRARLATESGASQRAQQRSTEPGDAWTDIQRALDRGDTDKALLLAQGFVTRQPGYHYCYAVLGSVYVAMNDFTNAESAYERAVALYPIEQHEKALAAIRKRLARERGAPAQAR